MEGACTRVLSVQSNEHSMEQSWHHLILHIFRAKASGADPWTDSSNAPQQGSTTLPPHAKVVPR